MRGSRRGWKATDAMEAPCLHVWNATVNFSAKLIRKNNFKSFAYVYTADITLNTHLRMGEAVFETAGVWHCKCVAFKRRMLMEKL